MQKVTPNTNYYSVASSFLPKILLAKIKEHQFMFDLCHLRDLKIDTSLRANQLVRLHATGRGNNCLLDSIYQQIQQLIPCVPFLDFVRFVRERICKTKDEQLSINDDLEGTQIWTAVQTYLEEKTGGAVYFEFSVFFADNNGDLALVDMSGIESALGKNGTQIPLRIIVVNYNHYQPLFKAADIPYLEKIFNDLSIESTQTKLLPAYVVNMPLKVDSDDEGEISSDEENKDSFPQQAFERPDKYFRLFPKGGETRRGTIITPFFGPTLGRETPVKSEKKGIFPSLISLFEKEVSQISLEATDQHRVGVCVGFNKMRSLSRRRDESLLRCLNEQTETTIPIRKIGFLWDGIWQKSKNGDQTWDTVAYDEVRHFYKQLKSSNPELAEQFRTATEKHRAHMVPYREIRDAIKNHEATKQLTRSIKSINNLRDVYILFLDGDIKSFRHSEHAPGALSVFDENYLCSQFEIASTGYTINEPDNLVLEVGVLADLAVRNATAKHVKRGIYFPEPCTAVKIPQENETVPENFSDPNQKNYASPQEMPQLIRKVLERRKLDPQKSMVFDARGAIVTTLPTRMERSFSCHSTPKNGIILWGRADFKTMRDINQTHYNARDWAQRVLEALTYHDSLEINGFVLKDKKVIQDVLISLLSRLFNAFDPIELAKTAAEGEGVPFQVCLIKILHDYKKSLNDAIPPRAEVRRTVRKPRKNLQKSQAINTFWKQVDSIDTVLALVQNLKSLLIIDLSEKILAAAHESGAALAKLFKDRFCLDYSEMVVHALSVLIGKDEEKVNAQIPEIYTAMINDVSIIQSGSVRETHRKLLALNTDNFFGITPLHMAAIAGNVRVVLWLMENYSEIYTTMKKDSKKLIPLDYALTYCQKNGINLDLLFALYDDDEISDEIQEMIYKTIDDTSDQLMVLDKFRIKFGNHIITEGNSELFIQAILQGYNELAKLLYDNCDDCSDALYNAILELAPDVDDRLIDWASKLDLDLEEIRDELGESEAMLFEKNLGWNEEVSEHELFEINLEWNE